MTEPGVNELCRPLARAAAAWNPGLLALLSEPTKTSLENLV